MQLIQADHITLGGVRELNKLWTVHMLSTIILMTHPAYPAVLQAYCCYQIGGSYGSPLLPDVLALHLPYFFY